MNINTSLKIALCVALSIPLISYGVTNYQKAQIEERNRQQFFLDCTRRMFYADCHLFWNYSKGQEADFFTAPLKPQPTPKREKKGKPA